MNYIKHEYSNVLSKKKSLSVNHRRPNKKANQISNIVIGPSPPNNLLTIHKEQKSSSNGSTTDKNLLSSWGFPEPILRYYLKKGISRFFDWQVECLTLPMVIEQQRNLVYSAPTSAGKTMVADMLLFKTILERQKKAIIILPFVSITIEKVQSLKYLCQRMGIRIDSFAGNTNPRGGLQRVNVAVCTMEKANNMINKLIEEDKLSEIGLIIVDELHMIGDSSRGYILELLLTKIIYLKKIKSKYLDLQIVGMSATIPNLSDIAKWLDAELYVTNYRPIPLNEYVVAEKQIMSVQQSIQLNTVSEDQQNNICSLLPLRTIDLSQLNLEADSLHSLIYLTIETIVEGYSILVFCPTKSLCESLARTISKNIFDIGKPNRVPKTEREKLIKEILNKTFDYEKILSLITMLKRTGCDRNLESAVRFGCGYHHAGMTMEERAVVEQAFRDGILRTLCCTTTLSAGVNLPARRVMITSPYDYAGRLLEITNYRQMIGRAGRKGIDTLGESFIFCKPENLNQVRNLLSSSMKPVKSYLMLLEKSDKIKTISSSQEQQSNTEIRNSNDSKSKLSKLLPNDNLVRAVLEVIANGLVQRFQDIVAYLKCTFFINCPLNMEFKDDVHYIVSKYITQVLEILVKDYFICFHTENAIDLEHIGTSVETSKSTNETAMNINTSRIVATTLGKAVIASGISPSEGCFILKELERCRENLCLLNDLHLVYETTPIYIAAQLPRIDWNHYLQLYHNMDRSMKKVAELIGIREFFLLSQISGLNLACEYDDTMMIHQRFYASLALYDLIQEVSMAKVQIKYGLNKGLLQSLQQQASTFAGMLSTFCNRLGWSSLELLIEQFQPRLSFGIQRDLIDLVRLPCLSSSIARQLYSKGFDTVISLIYCKPIDIETALISSGNPLFSELKITDPSQFPMTKIYISTMDKFMTIRELSKMIIVEARILVENDIGQKLCFDELELNVEFQSKTKPRSPNQSLSFTTKSKRIKTQLKSPLSNNQKESIEGSSTLDTNRASTPKKYETPNLSISTMSFEDDSLLADLSLTNGLKRNSLVNVPKEINFKDEYENLLNDLINDDQQQSDKESNDQHSQDDVGSPTMSVNIGGDIEMFLKLLSKGKSFNKENQLPLMYESKVSLENFQLNVIVTQDDCQNFIEKIFIPQSQAPVTIALHFRGVLKKRSPIIFKRRSESVDVFDQSLPLKHSYNIGLCGLYVARLNHHDLYWISGQKALSYLRKNWFQHMTRSINQHNTGSLNQSTSNKQWRFVCYDVKQSLRYLYEAFEFERSFLLYHIDWFDFNVALWLLDPESNCFNIEKNDISDITKLTLKYQLDTTYFHKVSNVSKLKFKLPAAIEKSIILEEHQFILKTLILFNLVYGFLVKLREKNLYQSYYLIEIPSRLCLFLLETNPIQVDYEYLNKLQNSIIDYMKNIEMKIFKTVGSRFNIASSDQVAHVLYSECNLISNYFKVSSFPKTLESSSKKPPFKVSKPPRHMSTSKIALIKLQEACGQRNQLPRMIIEWRRLNHVLCNSIRGLHQYWHLEDDGKVLLYCHYYEWTRTGRINMHEPNLINFDKDFEITTAKVASSNENYGSPDNDTDEKDLDLKPIVIKIRKLIVSPEEYYLVTADYCQLELRILAHFSKDPNLLIVLNEPNNDVFKSIASSWKQIPYEQVDYETRQQAKQICYGIIYGMGDESLAEKLNVDKEEAARYKISFFERYTKLDQFIERSIQECKERGYVETISGRRRSISTIYSSNRNDYLHACRQAVNTKIQGSAADIIKIAMVAVQQQIDRHQFQARFILQMHDELMFQVHKDDINQFCAALKRQMENVSNFLHVLLPVKVSYGFNWSQMVQTDF